MKRLILAATLAIAVPAFAQDAAPPADAAAPAAPAEPAAAPAAPAAPPAEAAPPAAAAPAATAAPTDASSWPVCSAKVTDRCIEARSLPKKTWKKRR